MNTNVDSKIVEQDDSIPPELLALAEIAYNTFSDKIAMLSTPKSLKFQALPEAVVDAWLHVAEAVASYMFDQVFKFEPTTVSEEELADNKEKGCGNNCAGCKCG